MTDRFIPPHEVQQITGGLSLATLWRMRKRGQFPEPVSVSPGRKAWRESDIERWMQSRTADNITSHIAA